METVLSGYCRTIDGSRMVLIEDGEADCDFEACAYRDVCQIGQQIARLQVVLDDIFPNFPIGSDVKLVIPVRVLHDASPLAEFVEQMHGLL